MEFPATPMAPVFIGMSMADNEICLRAHHWAYVAIVAALQKVQALRDRRHQSHPYTVWFESPVTTLDGWEVRHNRVVSAYEKMARRMATESMIYQPSNDDVKCKRVTAIDRINQAQAYVTPGSDGSHQVWLCPTFFDDSYLRMAYVDAADWARAFVLVHENYHAAVDNHETVAVADTAYSRVRCISLARNDPETAVRNAQNYAYCALGASGTDLPWDRPVLAPDTHPEYGLWPEPAVGSGWGPAGDAPAAAADSATSIVQGVIMVVCREPAERGGFLVHRALRRELGKEELSGGDRLRTLHNGQPVDTRCVAAPALAAWKHHFSCAYIDVDQRRLMHVVADATDAIAHRGDWSQLVWRGTHGEPNVIASGVRHAADSAQNPGPALAVYRPGAAAGQMNQSVGVYCVYIDGSGALRCAAYLDATNGWAEVPFDMPRLSGVTPALQVLDGRLVCLYVESVTHQVRVVTGEPVISAPGGHVPRPVTWRDGGLPAPPLHAIGSIALTLWREEGRETLVAMANKAELVDGSLRYCRLSGDHQRWTAPVRLATLTSTHVPALANIPGGQFLFYRSIDDTIQSRVGRLKL